MSEILFSLLTRRSTAMLQCSSENEKLDAKSVHLLLLYLCASVTRSASPTQPYMAPEVLCNEVYGVGVDMWATGVVAYELTHGERPFR